MGALTNLLRVLEIGDRGEVAGKLLADAGADVIRVEPPSGAASRHHGPFVDWAQRPPAEHSLKHAYWNLNKRGVTLDVTHPDGASLWRQLVATADVVIDSSGPDYLEDLRAGHASLESSDALIWCSVTPFGLTGPWRDWVVNDLVSMALGGPVMNAGYDGNGLPPVRGEGDHSLALAGAWAAIAILGALFDRQEGGQFIDLSIHEAVSCTVEAAFPNWEYHGRLIHRQTGRNAGPTSTKEWQHQTVDGEYIHLQGGGVPRDHRTFDALLAWLDEHNAAEDLHEPHYRQSILGGFRNRGPERERIQEVVTAFVKRLTVEEAYVGGQSLHLPFGHVRRPEENLDDPHWEDRDFFWESEVSGFHGRIRYPGAPYRFSSTSNGLHRRAPLLGEHNYDVYHGELGIDEDALIDLAQACAI